MLLPLTAQEMIPVGAPPKNFEHHHSSLLCQVIADWLQSTVNAYGRINWHDIATLLNVKVAESRAGESVTYTDLDCHMHWRYLAYGELHTTDERKTVEEKDFQHSEDTDEVMYPTIESFTFTVFLPHFKLPSMMLFFEL